MISYTFYYFIIVYHYHDGFIYYFRQKILTILKYLSKIALLIYIILGQLYVDICKKLSRQSCCKLLTAAEPFDA